MKGEALSAFGKGDRETFDRPAHASHLGRPAASLQPANPRRELPENFTKFHPVSQMGGRGADSSLPAPTREQSFRPARIGGFVELQKREPRAGGELKLETLPIRRSPDHHFADD